MTTKFLTVDFRSEDGKIAPVNPDLHSAAAAFCEKEFGAPLRLELFLKTWVAARFDEDGTLLKVTGIICLQQRLDMPCFHMASPDGDSRGDVVQFLRENDGLIDRAKNYIADNGGYGSEVFVHVAPEAAEREAVKRNLKRLGARASNRVVVTID